MQGELGGQRCLALLQPIEPGLRISPSAGGDQRPAAEHEQPGMGHQHLRRELTHPALQRADEAHAAHRQVGALHQPGRGFEIVRVVGVPQGLDQRAVCLEPVARARMDCAHLLQVTRRQALLQEAGKQRMQAIPRRGTVHLDREEQEVVPLQLVKQGLRLRVLCDVADQVGIEAPADGDLLDEVDEFGRQPAHHVL
ncbi:hypothetical protein D3C87_1214690 [compost metagenome]